MMMSENDCIETRMFLAIGERYREEEYYYRPTLWHRCKYEYWRPTDRRTTYRRPTSHFGKFHMSISLQPVMEE